MLKILEKPKASNTNSRKEKNDFESKKNDEMEAEGFKYE